MARLKTIENLKNTLTGGGARPNLFEVVIPAFPESATRGSNEIVAWNDLRKENFSFLCKAAALPASNVAPIDVPFRGRILKVAGDRTFDVWTVTIINDENFRLRNAFEVWMNSISELEYNTGATNPHSYAADAYVNQLGRGKVKGSNRNFEPSTTSNASDYRPLKSYKFEGIFPTSVSAIDLSYDSTDTLEEFTVEFQVQYWSAGRDDGNNRDQTGLRIS